MHYHFFHWTLIMAMEDSPLRYRPHFTFIGIAPYAYKAHKGSLICPGPCSLEGGPLSGPRPSNAQALLCLREKLPPSCKSFPKGLSLTTTPTHLLSICYRSFNKVHSSPFDPFSSHQSLRVYFYFHKLKVGFTVQARS